MTNGAPRSDPSLRLGYILGAATRLANLTRQVFRKPDHAADGFISTVIVESERPVFLLDLDGDDLCKSKV
jgi:hypothetical protein